MCSKHMSNAMRTRPFLKPPCSLILKASSSLVHANQTRKHKIRENHQNLRRKAMASKQVRRDNTTSEREVQIEKDRVPKMTSHFESLTVHVQDSDATRESGKYQSHDSGARSGIIIGEVGAPGKARESHEIGSHDHFGSLAGKVRDKEVGDNQKQREKEQQQRDQRGRSGNMVGDKEAEARRGREEHEQRRKGPYDVGKFEMSGSEQERPSNEAKGREESHEQEKRIIQQRGKEEGHQQREQGREMLGKEEGRGQQEQPSLEEISELRGQARQNSMETIKAAEERYNQAKEEARRKLGSATEYAAQKGSQAKDTLLEGAQKTAQTVTEKGSQAKETALEKGSQAKDTLLEGAQRASQTVTEKGSQTKDTVLEKGSQAKDALVQGAQRTTQFAAEKGSQAKDTALEKASQATDTAVDTSKKVASYTGEKAAAAKDVTVESGKGAAEYAAKVTEDVKDKAVVAGWSTAHYTTEKAMEGTGVVAKVAQYTTEKAVEGTKTAAKAVQGAADYAGHKAVEIASKPLGAAKEAAVSTGDSMKDYTARKKEEAERELEAKRAQRGQDTKRSFQEGGDTQQPFQGGQKKGEQQYLTTKAEEKVEEFFRPVASTIQQTLGGAREHGEQDAEQGRQGKGFTEHQRGDNRGGQQSLTSKAEEKVEGRNLSGSRQDREVAESEGGENRGGGAADVLSAIGETVVEIAKTTRDFVVGDRSIGERIVGHADDQTSQAEYDQHGETRREQMN